MHIYRELTKRGKNAVERLSSLEEHLVKKASVWGYFGKLPKKPKYDKRFRINTLTVIFQNRIRMIVRRFPRSLVAALTIKNSCHRLALSI